MKLHALLILLCSLVCLQIHAMNQNDLQGLEMIFKEIQQENDLNDFFRGEARYYYMQGYCVNACSVEIEILARRTAKTIGLAEHHVSKIGDIAWRAVIIEAITNGFVTDSAAIQYLKVILVSLNNRIRSY